MLNSERWMCIAQQASINSMGRVDELEDDYWDDELYRMYNTEAQCAKLLAEQWKGIENANQG
jgi:hypothetical protein